MCCIWLFVCDVEVHCIVHIVQCKCYTRNSLHLRKVCWVCWATQGTLTNFHSKSKLHFAKYMLEMMLPQHDNHRQWSSWNQKEFLVRICQQDLPGQDIKETKISWSDIKPGLITLEEPWIRFSRWHHSSKPHASPALLLIWFRQLRVEPRKAERLLHVFLLLSYISLSLLMIVLFLPLICTILSGLGQLDIHWSFCFHR